MNVGSSGFTVRHCTVLLPQEEERPVGLRWVVWVSWSVCFCVGSGADEVGWRCCLGCLVVSQASVSLTVMKEQLHPHDITTTSALRITAQYSKHDRSRDHALIEHSYHDAEWPEPLRKVGGSGPFITGICVTSPVQFIVYVNSQVIVVHNLTPWMEMGSQDAWSSSGPSPVHWCLCNVSTSAHLLLRQVAASKRLLFSLSFLKFTSSVKVKFLETAWPTTKT